MRKRMLPLSRMSGSFPFPQHRPAAVSIVLRKAVPLDDSGGTALCSRRLDDPTREVLAILRYTCHRIDTELAIDGNLAKPEWLLAPGASLLDTVTGAVPVQPTTAKLLWSERFLYVAFACEDDAPNATMTGFNDKLYEEEVVEIFVDDDNDLRTYIEIEVNPLNAVLHYAIHNHPDGHSLAFARTDCRLTTAVRLDPEQRRWTAEIAIPFTEFVAARRSPPHPGDEWRMNLYRIDRPQDGSPDEYSAWSPTGEVQFHKPDRFGLLIFADREGSSPPPP
ncbi:carbohydrate-binding family 9-like protein [Cohnella fermenti]|uniref:Carbohydrate-binding domain-containing protein n=1 Tax=Cohnella fermenti TaxID=2565925 RepID=A0A4S4BIX2_9BACL|nr:carbohydrate-binding family 9-like protein [Cohnella fermenti]THF74587.1 hypothetical protein E6C55_24620 [Cohnella fermenti]